MFSHSSVLSGNDDNRLKAVFVPVAGCFVSGGGVFNNEVTQYSAAFSLSRHSAVVVNHSLSD